MTETILSSFPIPLTAAVCCPPQCSTALLMDYKLKKSTICLFSFLIPPLNYSLEMFAFTKGRYDES